jgi:hypothetical protein
MLTIPRLHLTHGQVAWAICDGQPPDQKTFDQLRYLRQLGVPFTETELGVGRGNRLTYHYDQLIECGVEIWAMRRGVRPRQAAEFLAGERARLRKLYRKALHDQRDGAMQQPWIKSRGRIKPTLDKDYAIPLFKGSQDGPARFDLMTMDEVMTFNASLGDIVARRGHDVQPLVPLGRLVLQLVTWALEAPELRTGPRTR